MVDSQLWGGEGAKFQVTCRGDGIPRCREVMVEVHGRIIDWEEPADCESTVNSQGATTHSDLVFVVSREYDSPVPQPGSHLRTIADSCRVEMAIGVALPIRVILWWYTCFDEGLVARCCPDAFVGWHHNNLWKQQDAPLTPQSLFIYSHLITSNHDMQQMTLMKDRRTAILRSTAKVPSPTLDFVFIVRR